MFIRSQKALYTKVIDAIEDASYTSAMYVKLDHGIPNSLAEELSRYGFEVHNALTYTIIAWGHASDDNQKGKITKENETLTPFSFNENEMGKVGKIKAGMAYIFIPTEIGIAKYIVESNKLNRDSLIDITDYPAW